MIIKELNISEFGGLKDLRITPDEGMNIIYGENESGKSTVLLFIKFMLYGLGRKAASNSDRERAISWSGHMAAGTMTFSHNGKDYRIERRFHDGARTGSEKVSVLCLDDGSQISTDRSPGEYFLGVPKEVFESSACVGQMRSAEINGERTAASIRNMLTSADENVDAARILKTLDGIRVEYLHKNKSGGSLYEDSKRIEQQKQRLERAREANVSIESESKRLENAKRDYAILKHDLEEKDALISEINKINIIKRFESLKEGRAELDAIVSRKEKCVSEALNNSFFPDSRHVERLRLSADRARASAERLAEKENLAAKAEELSYDPELSRLGERIEQRGGPDTLLRALDEKRAAAGRQNGLIAGVWIAQALFCVAGALLMVAGFTWGAAFFGWTAIAVGLTVKGARDKKRILGEIADMHAEYGAEKGALSQRLSLCLEHTTRFRSQTAQSARIRAELDEARRAEREDRERLLDLMAMTAEGNGFTTDDAYAECERLERFLADYEGLCRREEGARRLVEAETEALVGYDEEALRSEITIDPAQVTPAAVAEAERQRRFLAGRRNAFEQKVHGLSATVVQLKAQAEDPLPIADELAELEAKHARDREFYDALTLAMESIEQAGRTMQGSVTPAIAAYAGGIMSRVTESRYDTVRTTGSLELSLDSDGFSVRADSLSGGTRDLAYLALRMSLFTRIFGDSAPPLMLDESLCQLDDARAERLLALIDGLRSEGRQCLLFTSHKREATLCDKLGVEYSLISL